MEFLLALLIGLVFALMAWGTVTVHTAEIAEVPGIAPGSLTSWAASYCGTNAGTIAVNRDGLLITTGAHAGDVEGLIPKSGALIAASNFFKTSDLPWMQVKIKTPAAFTGIEYFFGFVDQEPDHAAASGKDGPGEYDNVDLVEGCYFWFDGATDSGKLCLGYKWADVDVGKVVLNFTPVVDTAYTLIISLDAARKIHFVVDGVELYVSSEAMADVDVFPAVYVIGNAKTLFLREPPLVGKTYT